MPTSRYFAYTTSPIDGDFFISVPGLTQFGNLAISGTSFPGSFLTWTPGPDESTGYVIAYTSSVHQIAGSGGTAGVQFWRSLTQSDSSFLTLSIYISNKHGSIQNFIAATQAVSWLNGNGYWSSYEVVYNAGLFKTTYAGYFADSVSFFASATPTAYGSNPATSSQTTSISEAGTDDGTDFSCQWLGYFKPTTTQTYTFFTSSDDASYMWIGSNAQSGFTTLNATVKNGGLHGQVEQSGTASLTAGTYYPIRIQFGERNGGDVMTFNYSTSTITKTTNVTGLVFYNPQTSGI